MTKRKKNKTHISKNKKKRKTFSGQQKKQHAAQMLKEYYERLVKFAASCGLIEILLEIPYSEIDIMMKNRLDSYEVEVEGETKLEYECICEIINYLDQELNNNTFKILPDQDPVSLYDFFTVGGYLYFMINTHFNLSSQPNNKIEEKLSVLVNCFKIQSHPNLLIRQIFIWIMLQTSTINKGFYFPELSYGKRRNGLCPFYVKIKLHYSYPESIEIECDGKKRPVYRVGWIYSTEEIRWAELNPCDLNMDFFKGDYKLPVYIQSHALIRLQERLDCLVAHPVNHYMIFESISKKKIRIRNDKTILLKYLYRDLKLGYFVLEVIEGVVVIKTFLFLTNDNTPEGQKLQELAGFNKLDKKYWAIDKLSTFFSEELRSNKQVCELFKAAGCGELLTMEKEGLQDYWKKASHHDLLNFMEQVKPFQKQWI